MNNWGNRCVEGTCRHYAPGHIVACAAEILKSVGDGHFAAEHNELVGSGVEAALTSGRRAVKEILEGVKT